MAHNLNYNEANQQYSFFSVKERARHDLGKIVVQYPTSAEAIKFAGLHHHVEKRPLFTYDTENHTASPESNLLLPEIRCLTILPPYVPTPLCPLINSLRGATPFNLINPSDMTRSNLSITLSNGEAMSCVAESSSAPEQGYIVESLLLPLLSLNEPDAERSLLNEHCTMNELRSNATYRYEVNLQNKTVAFFDEIYFLKTDTFHKGKDLTHRYAAYLLSIKNKSL